MNEVSALVNGIAATHVSIVDRGFQYGDGVFETLAVYDGAPLLWGPHLARLQRGAERLAIPMPAVELLAVEARRLCGTAHRAVLKIILTRGSSGRGYEPGAGETTRVLYLAPWPAYPVEFARTGVSLCVCATTLSHQPRLAGIKHLNRLEQVLARGEWRTEYAEGIMCDDRGAVVEGTMSNVFAVTDGVLRTPTLVDCGVEGVMRAEVLAAARREQLAFEVTALRLDDLERADEMFVTNSLIGVWPVRQLQEREYSIGPITRKIQAAVRETHCFDRD
jgi:4-amino-4-deoxychorismate lyase